jgi:hypothetical protein
VSSSASTSTSSTSASTSSSKRSAGVSKQDKQTRSFHSLVNKFEKKHNAADYERLLRIMSSVVKSFD